MFDFMTPNMTLFLVLVSVVGAVVFFIYSNPVFVDGFKKGMHEARIKGLIKKQQKLTRLRMKIKEKARKVQEKREALEQR